MSTPQTIAVFGASGQVATALTRAAATRSLNLVARGRPGGDLTDPAGIAAYLDATAPALVVNAAAYTAVDRAETDREAAFKANADGPGLIAAQCARHGVPLIHISTDYVFDGAKRTPYVETDPVSPLGVYGASKEAGERAVRDALDRHIILRTSWVYHEAGHNFLKTMLRLAETREEIGVVDDQRGSPTYAGDLADTILSIADHVAASGAVAPWGTYHVTNSGETTWAGFAREIFDLAARRGRKGARVRPITTAEYPTPARRPAYSVLDNSKLAAAFAIRMPSWNDGLRRCLERLS